MPANSQLLAIVKVNPDWKLKNSALVHKDGGTVQKTQANKRWSAWSNRVKKIVPDHMLGNLTIRYHRLNHFNTPEEAMKWVELPAT